LQPLWEIRDSRSEGSEGNLKSSEKSFGYSEKVLTFAAALLKRRSLAGKGKGSESF